MGAKSSTLASVIRVAERTGKCEIRPDSYVQNSDRRQRSRDGRDLFRQGSSRGFPEGQGGGVARTAESPRLLPIEIESLSEWLANSSGLVGNI
jgi:hypothetical protein